GAIALLGSGQIEVGPAMLKNNLDITYAIVWLLALANVVGTVICIAASGGIAKLTTIRFVLLAPFLFMIISFAAFQSGQNLMDLVALFAIGFLGILMRRFDWSRPAFLIGFVLSNPAETYANQAIQIAQSRFRKGFGEGIDYIFSPIVIILVVITVISVVLGLRQAKHIMAEGDITAGSKRAPMIFMLLVTAFIGYALYDAMSIPSYSRDRTFPIFVASICLIGCAFLIIRMMLKPETDTIFADRELNGEDADATHGLWPTLAWFGALLLLTSLLGFILALAIFLFAFMVIRARVSMVFAAGYTAAGIAFICAMAWLLNRDFPPGLLQEYFTLPWPFT
ncbi:MAG: tripartite tricarboxylate transporter permease, partial [Sulfitobacter sp.]